MTLDVLIMIAGGLVLVRPFLGIPRSWDTMMFVVVGLFVMLLGILVRRRLGRKPGVIRSNGTFSEHAPGANESV